MSGARTLLAIILAMVTPVAAEAQTVGNPHGALPEGITCSDCHSTAAWSPLREDPEFDHAGDTGYELDGMHQDATCASCHAGLRFEAPAGDPGDCASCHVDVHQGSSVRTCASCHTTESFTRLDPGLVHPADFPLEGAHLQTSCESCHTNDLGGAFAPVARECVACHLGDYQRAPLVDHAALGFSIQCLDCHSTLDFRDVAFDHLEVSGGFELVGRHAGIECTSCHSLPGGGLPVVPAGVEDCVSCHLGEYQEEHGGSGFPTTCLSCHNVNGWDDATFDHGLAAGFVLLPNHDRLDCVACHVGSSSETLFQPSGPEDCYACHAGDYQREHAGSDFPTDCTACHRATTWDGAAFSHAFPISSGAHAGADCAACHTTPGDYGAFSCLDCHAHRQSEMDDEHRERSGYAYESNACLSCHPDGRG